MKSLEVNIIAFADDSNPGWVKCVFEDIYGRQWTFIEKAPVVSEEFIDKNSIYRRKGSIAVTILSIRIGDNNRTIITIDTGEPWCITHEGPAGVSDEEEESIFEVFSEKIKEF